MIWINVYSALSQDKIIVSFFNILLLSFLKVLQKSLLIYLYIHFNIFSEFHNVIANPWCHLSTAEGRGKNCVVLIHKF